MKMKFEYELTKQDLIDFNLFHIMYAKSTRRSAFIQRYIFSLSFIVFPIFLRQFSIIPFEYSLAVFVLFYLYWVMFYPKRLRKIVSKRISNMLNQGGKNSVTGTHNLTISEDGIVDKSEHAEASTQFKAIDNIVEDKEHIYIYASTNSAHIIPARIFVNDAEKNNFLVFLKQRMSD